MRSRPIFANVRCRSFISCAALRHIIPGAKTIVFSVDYSLAPENPYPAAINDAWTALQWVHSAEGQKELGHNPAKVAVGGSSR
jgi:acetyl esterase